MDDIQDDLSSFVEPITGLQESAWDELNRVTNSVACVVS